MATPTQPVKPSAPQQQNVPEFRFTLSPTDQKLSDAAITAIQNDVLKSVQQHVGATARFAWLEAGGYVKFSKAIAVAAGSGGTTPAT